MTYLLCGEMTCIHHDGDGCMLEEVELTTEHVNIPACSDFEEDAEKVREHRRRQELEGMPIQKRRVLRELGLESGLRPDPSLIMPSVHAFREAGLIPRDRD